jgi:YVTN family beta-propeller protein
MPRSLVGRRGWVIVTLVALSAMFLMAGFASSLGRNRITPVSSVSSLSGDSRADFTRGPGVQLSFAAHETPRVGPDGSAGSSATTIPVGSDPSDEVYDSARGEVFVLNTGSDNVSVISDTENRVVATIPVGITPTSMAYDESAGEVFVANSGGGGATLQNVSVSVINDTSNAVVRTFPVYYYGGPPPPVSMAFDGGNGEIFVAISVSNSVSVMDPMTGAFIANVSVRSMPDGITYDPAQGEVFVAEGLSDVVSVINDTTDAVVTQISVGDYPRGQYPSGLAYDSDRGEVLVGMVGVPDNVTIINATSNLVVANVPISRTVFESGGPLGVAYDGANQEVLVANPACQLGAFCNVGPGNLSVVDDRSDALLANIPVGNAPDAVVYDSGRGELFVATTGADPRPNYGPPQVSILDADQPLPYNITIAQTRTSTDVGQPVWFNATDDGYLGSLNYSYTAPSFAGCGLNDGPIVECTPLSPGNFTLVLNVTRPALTSYSWVASSESVAVSPRLTATLTLSNSMLWLGDTIGISGNVTGGKGPYTHSFLGLPPGCVDQASIQIGCLPTESGNYTILLGIEDSNDWSASAQAQLSVGFNFTVATPTNAVVGLPVTIHVDSAPGFGGLTYGYSGLPPGCSSRDVATLSCTPSQAGKYFVVVSVHDQAGNRNAQTVVVNVSAFLGLPGYDGYYLLVAAAVATVSGVAVLRYRRGRIRGDESEQRGRVDLFREYKQAPVPADEEPVGKVAEGEADPAGDIF